MTIIGVIVLIAIVGFVAWLLTLPGVPIASPFRQIIIGVLVIAVLLYILQAYGLLGARDFGRLR